MIWPMIWHFTGRVQLAAAGVSLLGLAACASPPAQDASAAAPTCINPMYIKKQEILSDRQVRFEMNDGTAWINTLKQECHGLKFEGGFEWNVRGAQVCADQQIITVLKAGNTCTLGTFAKAPAAPA